MQNWKELQTKLSRSKFRSGFRLNRKEREYFLAKGEKEIREHAYKFIKERLAPAEPNNDGRQTPMRGHPVFIAQHATATCCRKCLAKWHDIKKDEDLTIDEIVYVVTIITDWIKRNL